jgi:hypothetical protein
MKLRSLSLPMTLAALVVAAPAFAHHSFAMFDGAKTLTLDGTVKEFELVNPHSWIDIMVTNDAGVAQEWSFEMGSPAGLSKQGMVADSVKPGDKVTLRAHPMKDGSRGGQFMSVTMADGRIFGQRPRPPGAAAPGAAAPATAKD